MEEGRTSKHEVARAADSMRSNLTIKPECDRVRTSVVTFDYHTCNLIDLCTRILDRERRMTEIN